jgi:hypothetical protein
MEIHEWSARNSRSYAIVASTAVIALEAQIPQQERGDVSVGAMGSSAVEQSFEAFESQ